MPELTLAIWAVALVLAAGVFAAADSALGAVSRARVTELVRQGRTGARQLERVLDDRPRHVNLLLLLRTACELTATVLVTVMCLRLMHSVGLAGVVAVIIMVVAAYVLVGVGPRTIGRQHPYAVGRLVAAPVRQLARLLTPLTRLLIVIGNLITPGRGFREGPFSSEIELRELVDLAQETGVVAAGQREMIHSVFELGDTLAREVMVPRTEIVWIERTESLQEALALSLRSGFSRIPVIGESVDDIVGIVTLKELAEAGSTAGNSAVGNSANGHAGNSRNGAGATALGAQRPERVAEVMRPASFVPDSKRLDDLLREMQWSRSHLVIAVDEYGGTAGLVTIEDVLEEIVGEITDESDREEHKPIEHLGDGTVRVSARLPVADLGEEFSVELDDSEVETVSGLLAQHLGRVPLPGAEAEISGLRLRAEGRKDQRGRIRITSLLVRRAQDHEQVEGMVRNGNG